MHVVSSGATWPTFGPVPCASIATVALPHQRRWRSLGVSPALGEPASALGDAYAALGAAPSFLSLLSNEVLVGTCCVPCNFKTRVSNTIVTNGGWVCRRPMGRIARPKAAAGCIRVGGCVLGRPPAARRTVTQTYRAGAFSVDPREHPSIAREKPQSPRRTVPLAGGRWVGVCVHGRCRRSRGGRWVGVCPWLPAVWRALGGCVSPGPLPC